MGSTTGYSRFMIPGLVKAAADQGYSPDVIVAADEVGGEAIMGHLTLRDPVLTIVYIPSNA